MEHGWGRELVMLKTINLWYKEQVSFHEKGIYNVSIKHAVRNNGASRRR